MFRHISGNLYGQQSVPKIVTKGGMRQYTFDDELYPSITSILSRMIDSDGINAWKERVGEDVAKLICNNAIKRGNNFHKICESYLNNNDTNKFRNHLLEHAMFEHAKPALDRINNIVAIELPMISRELGIGGTSDILADFDGVLSVIDLKSSTNPKPIPWCQKFFLQETGYSLMFEELTSTPVEQIITLIVSENGEVQVLVRNRDAFTEELKQIIEKFQSAKISI